MALVVAGTDFIQMPAGTTAQRPSVPAQGMQRYNTTLGYTEVYSGTTWLGVAVQNASNNLLMNSGYGSDAVAYGCRAWVNFNGTGTVAIRGSGNVSSITDNGTGDFTINFSNALPDLNYSASIMGSVAFGLGASSGWLITEQINGLSTLFRTTSSFRILSTNLSGASTDGISVNASFFR